MSKSLEEVFEGRKKRHRDISKNVPYQALCDLSAHLDETKCLAIYNRLKNNNPLKIMTNKVRMALFIFPITLV